MIFKVPSIVGFWDSLIWEDGLVALCSTSASPREPGWARAV